MQISAERMQLLRQAAERGKYRRLYHHLRDLPGNKWQATFAEIERLLEFKLPNSARLHRPWWSNQGEQGGHSHALAWETAGWKTAQVNMSGEIVVFVRDEGDTLIRSRGSFGNEIQSLPESPSSPTVSPLTAQKVFASWPFDFEFLMNKANHELALSMTEAPGLFLPNALNFSVTIHAIADHLWHAGENRNPQWPTYGDFLTWLKTQNDCIGIFIDLSNTYKHTERDRPNRFADSFQNMTFPEDWVDARPPDELRNRIIDSHSGNVSLWPVLTTTGGRLIYYRYAAENALHWWRTNYPKFLP
jgi:hypothetical protein